MSSRTFIAFLLLFTASAGAQDAAQPRVSTVVVPVVASTLGPSMYRWLTDVELVNETSLPLDVAVELPAAPDAPAFVTTLSPGQVQRFNDIIGQAFGLPNAISPLRITTAGRRSITVRAHAYTVRGNDVSPMQRLDVYANDTWFPIRVLDGLAFSDSFRTNIGLVNFSDQDAEFVLALQRVPGRNVAITHLHVGAGGLIHSSIQSLFPLITNGSGFSVVVETPVRQTHVYASVIESTDNRARFIASRIGTR
jgi:hypothetical protein